MSWAWQQQKQKNKDDGSLTAIDPTVQPYHDRLASRSNDLNGLPTTLLTCLEILKTSIKIKHLIKIVDK